jgi:Uma2 family endonuclease
MHMAATELLTAEQFERMPSLGRWVELERGVVVSVNPPGYPHGAIAVAIAAELRAFVRPRQLGIVVVESGCTVARNPDTVRGPDVSYVRRERAMARTSSYLSGAPDLAVEIRSPDDAMASLTSRADEYLAAGAQLVWLVDPASRTVRIHAPAAEVRTLTAGDELDGGAVLPGFAMEIAAVFETA